MNFDEALEAGAAFFMEDHPAAEKQYINAKLCTNQPGYVERNGNNGCVVSYAQGSMDFFRTVKNPGKINQRNVDGFKTPRGEGLKYLFDDRTAVQPFAKQSADKLGLRVERAQNGVIATFTLESCGKWHVYGAHARSGRDSCRRRSSDRKQARDRERRLYALLRGLAARGPLTDPGCETEEAR